MCIIWTSTSYIYLYSPLYIHTIKMFCIGSIYKIRAVYCIQGFYVYDVRCFFLVVLVNGFFLTHSNRIYMSVIHSRRRFVVFVVIYFILSYHEYKSKSSSLYIRLYSSREYSTNINICTVTTTMKWSFQMSLFKYSNW